MWVLGTKLWSSTRATSALNHWAICPAQYASFCCCLFFCVFYFLCGVYSCGYLQSHMTHFHASYRIPSGKCTMLCSCVPSFMSMWFPMRSCHKNFCCKQWVHVLGCEYTFLLCAGPYYDHLQLIKSQLFTHYNVHSAPVLWIQKAGFWMYLFVMYHFRVGPFTLELGLSL